MADFTRMSAAEADTELREMRQMLLQQLAELEKKNAATVKTQRRIHAINRALRSLTAERPEQGKLLDVEPTDKMPVSTEKGSYSRAN